MKTSLAAFGRVKSMSWRHHDAIAHASTKIEFQEALIRFSKLGFPVTHGKFLGLQYEDYVQIPSSCGRSCSFGEKNLNNVKSNF